MMKMTLLAVAIVLVASVFSVSAARPKWHQLTADYSYEQYLKDLRKPAPASADEYAQRKALFAAELQSVLEHNAKVPAMSWRKGINKFSDWTEAEKKRLRGHDAAMKQRLEASGKIRPERIHKVPLGGAKVPVTVDWRTAVPPILTTVKDQGACGSCWSHASTEVMETAWARATGMLFTLSQQQVASCTPNPDECGGTGGCGGGIAELGILGVAERGGIVEEWSCPYQIYMGTDIDCKSLTIWQNLTKAKFTGYTAAEKNSGESVKHALATLGPQAISVDASQWSSYESGYFSGCNYSAPYGKNSSGISMDHAVMASGYSADPVTGQQYVIVRNSWGAEWGEAGYINLAIYVPGMAECGWNNDPMNGYGCAKPVPQTAPQWVCGMCGVFSDVISANADYSA